MATKSVPLVSGGVGFPGLLTVLFIGLKLTNVIAWSWLWVLSPLWISFLLGMFVLIICSVIVAVMVG